MNEPREAWVILKDGERVSCLLEEVAPREWQATPIRNVSLEDVIDAGIDVLPGASQVNFVFLGQEE